jgi:hypothetical protein
MKFIYILLFASSLCVCSSKNSNLEQKLRIDTFVKGVYDRNINGVKIYLVGLKLINISDTPVEFLTMSCTTGSNIVLNTSQLEPVVNNCASNYPVPITLNPKQEFDFVFLLKATDSHPNSIKIGWVLLTKQNTPNVDKFLDSLYKFRENLENIIWAKPIELNCCAFSQFEIK